VKFEPLDYSVCCLVAEYDLIEICSVNGSCQIYYFLKQNIIGLFIFHMHNFNS